MGRKGKIVIDGYIDGNVTTTNIHGGKRDKSAFINLIMPIERNEEVKKLLLQIIGYLDNYDERGEESCDIKHYPESTTSELADIPKSGYFLKDFGRVPF